MVRSVRYNKMAEKLEAIQGASEDSHHVLKVEIMQTGRRMAETMGVFTLPLVIPG